jgi:hypothetical protein
MQSNLFIKIILDEKNPKNFFIKNQADTLKPKEKQLQCCS